MYAIKIETVHVAPPPSIQQPTADNKCCAFWARGGWPPCVVHQVTTVRQSQSGTFIAQLATAQRATKIPGPYFATVWCCGELQKQRGVEQRRAFLLAITLNPSTTSSSYFVMWTLYISKPHSMNAEVKPGHRRRRSASINTPIVHINAMQLHALAGWRTYRLTDSMNECRITTLTTVGPLLGHDWLTHWRTGHPPPPPPTATDLA